MGMQKEGAGDQTISLKRLKKLICEAEGYKRNMLALLYGSTGIMRLEDKTEFIGQGEKIKLHDISETNSSAPTLPVSTRNNRGLNGNTAAAILTSFQNPESDSNEGEYGV
mmetsp:Transcript_19223/g.26041  ORF Transcript_19223/g.26041 Transcript_19223/m.26041 type:complete len:110 (-) Transcript_19223:1144-1473(-)|eukprot:CAMPEP_0185587772 /NCGR_PEP_ID=MMETSP0434-20130131/50501_1 /TAXON_ID=626734 ORGANISM="Favella taraikaensis, Strain Fe Narragansett Bay" /NCGR_SAMPLE_ID=MMETSP0434 /ASSEMBLY_ACC=CAM_ASM_000379 /LENGTH=109 /DNA_ID=CAMNT_0028209933 /DNA_START=104 /DNA_END=433 /DNA_ORIENTATION=-